MSHDTETDRQPERDERPAIVVKLLFSSGVAGQIPREIAPIQSAAIGSEGLAIGREVTTDAGIPLPHDRRASAVHVRLFLTPDGVALRDESSKNGTFVNGQRVTSVKLEDRAVLRIGNSVLLLRHQLPPSWSHGKAAAAVRSQDLLHGVSMEMDELRYQLLCAAERPSPVLLLGATGTGKERAARFLHAHSTRRDKPLVCVNCASIPTSLAESTLFGHVAGAFTGAQLSQQGLLRKADGGTLFLDEVGEMPTEIQPKLLRALEEQLIWPVGAREPVRCDLRLIAATNRDLDAAVETQSFRADLLARLAVLRIKLPTLCERREDILPLFMHYFGRPAALTARLAEALLLYPWPLNVRELVNVAEHARTFAEPQSELDLPLVAERLKTPRELVTMPAVPTTKLPGPSAGTESPATRSRMAYSDEFLLRVLRENAGVVSRIAERLGLSRRQVGRVLSARGLDINAFRRSDEGPEAAAVPELRADAAAESAERIREPLEHSDGSEER